MPKLNLSKLASTLSGRERAKLMITSWHEAIIGKQTFSEADRSALAQFDKYEEGREFRYFMSLYKYGYTIYKEEIEQTFLKIVALCMQLHQFHTAFAIDGTLRFALRAIGNVPKFISEAKFKQKREAELEKRTELVVCLANYETNALLNTKHWLGEWERESILAELEQEFGSEWIKTFWEQVERIRALVKEGKLQSASITESEKRYSEVVITKVEDAITVKSWLGYDGRHSKDYQPYLETDELYAVSYNSEDNEFEEKMRKDAFELCNMLSVVKVDYKKGLEQLSINEESRLIEKPQEMLRALEQQIQLLFTYKAATEAIEDGLDGLPLFDEKSYGHIKEEYDHAAKIVDSHNEFIEKLEEPKFPHSKVELIDKEKYLLKTLPVLTEEVDRIVNQAKELAEHEIQVIYR